MFTLQYVSKDLLIIAWHTSPSVTILNFILKIDQDERLFLLYKNKKIIPE